MYGTGFKMKLAARHFLPDAPSGEASEHSHDYAVEVTVIGDAVDDKGYLVDINSLRASLDTVLARYDGRCLNAFPEFDADAPSMENLAREIWKRVTPYLSKDRVRSLTVRVWEDDDAWAGFEGPVQ
ncbi:MAG: 6-carboxytetrahydropterin synthase [Methanomassiliicoccus sp.]|nr:6-carboxytetrahydropterin synthase [Methanomassiliicoccus sp.]